MSQPNAFAAKLLETGASAYAGYATNLLFERQPEVKRQFAPSAFRGWKAHLTERLLELAAAVAEGEPRLFASRVQWARTAREISDDGLRASLVCLREVLREELPEPAREEASRYLEAALTEFEQPSADDGGLDPGQPGQRLALEYLQAALKGGSRRAVDLVAAAVDDDALALEAAYLEVLLPAQREIGRLWHLAELSIAEEHFLTETTQRAMSVLCHRAVPRTATGKTVIAAAVAGNVHDIGVRAVADFFELAGWRAIRLGGDIPAAEIAGAVEHFDADLVILSAALAPQLKAARQAVEAVRGVSDSVKILVGGLAYAASPELWKSSGADGYAPAADAAVALGASLLGLEDPHEGDYPKHEIGQLRGHGQQLLELTRQLEEANRKLLQQAEVDPLTELANRRKFDLALDREWRRCTRDRRHLTLILADIDHFEHFNDRYGHQRGDVCLQRVASVLDKVARRPGDLACRWEGEKFALILPGVNAVQGPVMAEYLRRQVEQLAIEHLDAGPSRRLTVSLGVAAAKPRSSNHPEDLVAAADQALHRAKEEGRNRVESEAVDGLE